MGDLVKESGDKSKIWTKGAGSPNPNGRPKGTGKPISKLRSLVRKLQEMEEKALENIKFSLEGKDIDKSTVDTSKWVVTTIVTTNRAATAEENLKHEMKMDLEASKQEDTKATGTNDSVPVRPRFSTSIIKKDDEDVGEE